MRKTFAALVAAFFVASCTVAPAGTGPTLAPGLSLVASPYSWSKQGPPTGKLATVLAVIKAPADVATILQGSYPWQDDYDTMRFLSPDELVSQGRGVCSAFARFWTYALARQGRRAEFIAVWGLTSAHAFAMFRDADGLWRLCSNQYLYSQTFGYDRDGAIAGACSEFYGQVGGWSEYQVFDPDSGAIRARVQGVSLPTIPLALAASVPGRNVFTIKR